MVTSDRNLKNEHINQAKTRSYASLPAGQATTVTVSTQYDPRQKVSELLLNMTASDYFSPFSNFHPKNMRYVHL
jgi:hypothetical protein